MAVSAELQKTWQKVVLANLKYDYSSLFFFFGRGL